MSEPRPMPTKQEVQIAMLDSLARSFTMADDGGPLLISLNFGDVAELLHDCSDLMRGGRPVPQKETRRER